MSLPNFIFSPFLKIVSPEILNLALQSLSLSIMTKKKFIKRLTKRLIVLAIFSLIYWPLPALYLATGIYDVLRQKNKNKNFIFQQYFLVNGTLVWIFSPLNTLIDILCLPYLNKQIYKLEDLPKKHREEITRILEHTPNKMLTDALDELSSASERSMMFYKWYGFNVDNSYPCPLFHENFSRVLTIGVSSFKPNSQTSQHFGWLRAGIRVLINIDEDVDERAYLDVNNQQHVWKTDGPLFIFDDTVLHQSFNNSDKTRNCLFIDVVRPSLIPVIIKSTVKAFGFLSTRISAFSKLSKWKVVK